MKIVDLASSLSLFGVIFEAFRCELVNANFVVDIKITASFLGIFAIHD
jgi:hypothetical protein